MTVAVIDLGTSNMRSLTAALNFLGASHAVTTEATAVDAATHVILPGVGAFDAAMKRIHELSLADSLRRHALESRRPLLGVCLGMQLLFDGSEEGVFPGLGIVGGRFKKLTADPASHKKVPHVGFSQIREHRNAGLFGGLGSEPSFYFTHSYALDALNGDANSALCIHTSPFVAAFQKQNLCGAQFHPEKSQSNGLRFLSNFLEMS